MIVQRRSVFAMSVVLIIVVGLWMLDRYHLARKIKEERLRTKEQLAEKEAKLKMIETKVYAAQKELEEIRRKKADNIQEKAELKQLEVLKKMQELEQLYKEQQGVRSIEEDWPKQETQTNTEGEQ